MVITSIVMSIGATIDVVGLVVNDPLDWSVLPVGLKKRILKSFDGCSFLLYKCLFTRIEL